jgi:hypothetical protein
MPKFVDDWKDKQGIFEKHIVDGDNEESARDLLLRRIKQEQRNHVIEILEKYNKLLQEGSYVDDDIWCEGTTTIDQFLLKYYPKIE